MSGESTVIGPGPIDWSLHLPEPGDDPRCDVCGQLSCDYDCPTREVLNPENPRI